MTADYSNHQQKQKPPYLLQTEPSIWKACAGTSVQIPEVNSRVYYFPQGHMEHCSPPLPMSSVVSLPPSPLVPCRVLQVLYLVDPDTDEVFTRIRLDPRSMTPPSGFRLHADGGNGNGNSVEEASVVVSFAKVLTPSDANNGGGFSVPRFCADSIFPPLDYKADPPVQTVSITDMRGNIWNFRHIYRGTPRRHLLTTGWSKFVNSKRLISGDSVVFMKNKETGKMFVGIRRAVKSNNAVDVSRWAQQYGAMAGMAVSSESKASGKGKVAPETVVEALQMVTKNVPFEVVYYPKAGSQDFVVAAEKAEMAMGVFWSAGMRVRMAMETEDSSRLTWFQGTVSSVSAMGYGPWKWSPWRMLQVAWDEPENLENIQRVSPWQVEYVSPTPSIETAFPPAKKLRLPSNCNFLTEGGDLPLPPLGFSNSMNWHLSPPFYYNTPAGMQGARHVSNFASIFNNGSHSFYHVGYPDNTNLVRKVEAVSTELNIGSSSNDSSNSDLSEATPKAANFVLFGHTIHVDNSGSREAVEKDR